LERVARPQPAKPDSDEQSSPATPIGEPFRIQYLGGAGGQGSDILAEAVVTAPSVFAAFRLADRKEWPPGASGFRLLDDHGRDVFWRQRPSSDRRETVAEATRQPA